MTKPVDWQLRYAAGLPVWFPTHHVWVMRSGRLAGTDLWYTGNPQHAHGALVKHLDGLPVGDDSEAAHDTAAAVFRAAGLLKESS